MKRVINGVSYNDDTSTRIAQWKDEAGQYDPTDKIHILYKTRGGAFFLHEREEWDAKAANGDWERRHKDQFKPMTYEEAQKWVLDGDVEVFSDEFAPPEAEASEAPAATIFVRVPQSLKTRVEAAANTANLSINAWSLRCMERCLGAAAE